MEGYETPVLNQLAFGVGFGAAMFWPVWLVAAAAGYLNLKMGRRAVGWTLLAFAAMPAAVWGLFLILLAFRVDVGPMDGAVARALDFSGYVMVGLTAIAVVLVLAVMLSFLMSRIRTRGARHA